MSSSTNDESNKLQAINYANAAAYLANVAVVFGATKLLGLPDNATLSIKYQTLITPATYAFSIWGIIFPAQLAWTVVQLLPQYRATDLVIKGVGYNYVWACFAQCVWTILFGLEHMILSLLAMIGILVPLVSILFRTSKISSAATTTINRKGMERYGLLKFPFEIHAAWIMAATLVNVNVALVAYGPSASVQKLVCWACLVAVLCVGIASTALLPTGRRNWVIPCVLVWTSVAISVELAHPKENIVSTFSRGTIVHTKIISDVVALSVLLVTIVQVLRQYLFQHEQEPPTDDEGDGNDGGVYSALT